MLLITVNVAVSIIWQGITYKMKAVIYEIYLHTVTPQ